ncbi:MAG: DUF1080 domain-containing protein [Rhodopirellula sp.]|nr:DUF1080 domain-containing protein [Rhodopirellula sp.]
MARPSQDGLAIQLLDNTAHEYAAEQPERLNGSLWGIVAAKQDYLRPLGEWNDLEINCQGPRVRVTLNSSIILDVDLTDSTRMIPQGRSQAGRQRTGGHIGLNGYASQGRVEFRNIRIKDLGNAANRGPLPEPAETSRVPNTVSDVERAEGWRLLFDGKSLDDWKRPVGDAQFRVEEGAIVGMTHTGMKKTFLCREEGIEDFLLELDFKIDEGMNSGVQIRSQRNGNEISGYQVEIDSSGKWVTGAIFDEGRRNTYLGEVTDRDAADKAFRAGEWNSLYVSAVGDEIKTSLNGIQIAQVTDSASRSGFIGLQLHSMDSGGPPKQIRFRNIRMKSLPSTPPPATSATKEKPEAPRMPNSLTYAERAEGWRLLFDGKSLSGWRGSAKHYGVVDGKLVSDFGPKGGGQQEGGDLFTRREYGDFILRFDFRLEPGANSGVVVRASGEGDPSISGMEIQVIDDARLNSSPGWTKTGAIFGVAAPLLGHQHLAGEWNSMEITCQDRRLGVVLNQVRILDADLDAVARKPADGKNHPGLSRDRGYLGFQGYGSRGRVEYRDIRIKEIRP